MVSCYCFSQCCLCVIWNKYSYIIIIIHQICPECFILLYRNCFKTFPPPLRYCQLETKTYLSLSNIIQIQFPEYLPSIYKIYLNLFWFELHWIDLSMMDVYDNKVKVNKYQSGNLFFLLYQMLLCFDWSKAARIPKTATKMIENVCLVMGTPDQVFTAMVVVDSLLMNMLISS